MIYSSVHTFFVRSTLLCQLIRVHSLNRCFDEQVVEAFQQETRDRSGSLTDESGHTSVLFIDTSEETVINSLVLTEVDHAIDRRIAVIPPGDFAVIEPSA